MVPAALLQCCDLSPLQADNEGLNPSPHAWEHEHSAGVYHHLVPLVFSLLVLFCHQGNG